MPSARLRLTLGPPREVSADPATPGRVTWSYEVGRGDGSVRSVYFVLIKGRVENTDCGRVTPTPGGLHFEF